MEIKKLNEKLEQLLESEKIYTNKEFAEHVKSLLPSELRITDGKNRTNFYANTYSCAIDVESDFGEIFIGTKVGDEIEEEGEKYNYVYIMTSYRVAGTNKWIDFVNNRWGGGYVYNLAERSTEPNLDQHIKELLNEVVSAQKRYAQSLKDNDPATMFQFAMAKNGIVKECKLIKEGSFGQLYRFAVTDNYGKKITSAGIIKDGKAKKITTSQLLDIIEQL